MAKGRKYKCPVCGIYDHEDSMVVEKIGGQNKRIHKVDCYRKYEREKEFKKKEREELDELVEVIKETHSIGVIPNQFYSFLQDIRNGNELFGKVGQKKSKGGYTYRAISQTYIECKDTIDWAIKNKDFKNTMGMLKYTKAIILDNVYQVSRQIEIKKDREQQKQEVEQSYDYNMEKFNYKEKEDEQDISDLL